MKHVIIGLLTFVASVPFRFAKPLRYYWSRIWNSGRASAMISGLHHSVQFDGSVEVIGTAKVRIGEKSRIGDLTEFTTKHDGVIRIGKEVRLNRGATVCAYAEVSIGDYSMVGEFVSIRDANHGIKRGELVRSQPHDAKPVRIGSDVWVGRGVCILPGVTIGDGAIIGANSIVTKDVPPNCIAAGIPARVIRER